MPTDAHCGIAAIPHGTEDLMSYYRDPIADLFVAYRALKQFFPDEVLLIRIGAFYELFGECAVALTKVSRLTLFSHSLGTQAGFGVSELEKYRKKLEDAGYKVLLAEQDARGAFKLSNPNEKAERAEQRQRRKKQKAAQRRLEFEPGSGG